MIVRMRVEDETQLRCSSTATVDLGASPLSQSNSPIEHLLKQLESYAERKNEKKDNRPEWITDFINDVAELFEPITDVGRVGFDCQLAEDSWVVRMYMGTLEYYGGRFDGRTQFMNFEFNLQELRKRFARIDEFYWSSFPSPRDAEHSTANAFVTISGLIGENPIRLQILSVPPDEAGPGLRRHTDGQIRPI